MRWYRADKNTISAIQTFLARYEQFNISLISRVIGKGGLVQISPLDAELFVAYPHSSSEHSRSYPRSAPHSHPRSAPRLDSLNEPVGVVLLTRYGALFPLFSPEYSFDSKEIAALLTPLLKSTKNLFSVLGTEHDVGLCRPFLNRSEVKTIEYYLMVRNKEIPPPRSVHFPELTFNTLSTRNYKRVFPLEEMYQHEEVLVRPERYNRRAHMVHFKRAASEQHVIFAETKDGPVAKAGTNAIGIAHCQIGGVYTLPAFRRRGISRELMIRVLNWCRDAGLSAGLFVKKDNTAAVELYKNLAFDVVADYRIIYTSVV